MIYQFMPAVMVEEFGSTPAIIGDVSALMGLVWIVGSIVMSFVMHRRIHLKYVALFALVVLTVCAIFIPIPDIMWHFLLITAVVVFFSGGLWPIFTGAISNSADQRIQGKVLGLSQSVQSLSMMLAPFLGGFFLQAHSTVPFAISSVSALIAAALLTKAKNVHFQS